MNSNYDFPIFVSSTDYNLVDLRAEVKDYLDDLGYRVVLSSGDGFPDQTPNLQPWESCLPVLDKCFVVILIIDGRYGSKLEWPNFEKIIGSEKMSPTHGEYRYARTQGKRILVFIREGLMNDYQRYREAMKANESKTPDEKLSAVKEQLFLPKTVDFETLRFIEEVKTKNPIPWIRLFANVTEVKREVHRQLLNELAKLFINFGECQLQEFTHRFAQMLESRTAEQRQEILEKIGCTKDLIEQVESKTKAIEDSRSKIEQREKEIASLSQEKEKNRLQIAKLEGEKAALQTSMNELQQQNTATLIGATSAASNDPFLNLLALSGVGISGAGGSSFDQYASLNLCEKCGTIFNTSIFSTISRSKCPGCNRTLCPGCYGISLSGSCAECEAKIFTVRP